MTGVGLGDGHEHTLTRMLTREARRALDEANGADAASRQRRVRPLLERRTHALTMAHEAIAKRLLTRGRLGLAGARRIDSFPHAGVHGHERVAGEDADQVRVPAHANVLPEERQWYRIKRAADFDVAIGVDRALAAGEERKRLGRQRLERRLLDLDEVRPDLAARGAVNAQPRDRAIPVPQERILRVQAVKAPALERVVLDVAATALLLAVFLGRARLRRQGREAPMRREGQVDVVAIGIVKTGADDGRFQIVVPHHTRDATEVTKRAFVEPEERLELLIPDRFLIAVAWVAERHPKHPRPTPFTGGRVERRRAAEEIDLRFGPWGAVEHAHGPPLRRDRPHEPLHRFVAGAVAVLLD